MYRCEMVETGTEGRSVHVLPCCRCARVHALVVRLCPYLYVCAVAGGTLSGSSCMWLVSWEATLRARVRCATDPSRARPPHSSQ